MIQSSYDRPYIPRQVPTQPSMHFRAVALVRSSVFFIMIAQSAAWMAGLFPVWSEILNNEYGNEYGG